MKLLDMIADALPLTSFASIDYQVYFGRMGALIVEGGGGIKTVLGGYDIWEIGSPPRRYLRLGVVAIEDLDNVFGNQRSQAALVDAIKAANGSAAVVVGKGAGGRTMGSPISSTGVVTSGVVFAKKQQRYEIVTYLD